MREETGPTLGRWVAPFLVLVIGLIVIAPLLRPGYFWGAHDARHDVYFIFEYDKSVQDGIWLPRWSPDWTFGYGYPFFIIYAPLATFIGELFHRFGGLGFEESVKAVLAFSVLLSGLGMYGFVRSWLGRGAGLVAAAAYMVIPYHLVNLFVRAAMAESVALAFLPLALWGFREAVRRPRPAAILGAAMAYAAIMWSSNLVALVFTPALAAFVILQAALQIAARRRTNAEETAAVVRGPSLRGRRAAEIAGPLAAPVLAGLLGLGLSAAFFIPVLVEQRYINQTQWFGQYYDPLQHFVTFQQLFSPAWGFGISQPGPDDVAQGSMSFQLGAVPALLSLIALVTARRHSPAQRPEIWFWGLLAAASIFLTLGISTFVWRHVPLVPYAQFPWRYLMLAMLPLSILPATLAAGVRQTPDGRWQIAPFVLAAFLLLGSYPYLKVEVREPTPEQGPVSYSALMRFQRTSDEMTGVTAWVDAAQRPHWSDLAELWVQGKPVTTRVDYSRVPRNRTLSVNSERMGSADEEVYFYAEGAGQSITFNRFWYPGWTAYRLSGKAGRPVEKIAVEREAGPLARVVVPVPAGEGYILLRFEDTPLRVASRWVTQVTFALILLGLLAGIARSRRLRQSAT